MCAQLQEGSHLIIPSGCLYQFTGDPAPMSAERTGSHTRLALRGTPAFAQAALGAQIYTLSLGEAPPEMFSRSSHEGWSSHFPTRNQDHEPAHVWPQRCTQSWHAWMSVWFCSQECPEQEPVLQTGLWVQRLVGSEALQVVQVANNLPASAGEVRDGSSIPVLERSSEEGNVNPLWYSCLENTMDRRTGWDAFHGVAYSQT